MKETRHPDVYFRSNPWGQRATKYAAFVKKLNATQWTAIIKDAMAMHVGGDGVRVVNAVVDEDDDFGKDAIHIGWCVQILPLNLPSHSCTYHFQIILSFSAVGSMSDLVLFQSWGCVRVLRCSLWYRACQTEGAICSIPGMIGRSKQYIVSIPLYWPPEHE